MDFLRQIWHLLCKTKAWTAPNFNYGKMLYCRLWIYYVYHSPCTLFKQMLEQGSFIFGSRRYHVYKDTELKPIYINQTIAVSKLINLTSIWHYPHSCGIMIQGKDKIDPVTCSTWIVKVRFMFLQVDGVTSVTIVDAKWIQSLIPEGGLEIPCLLNFTHPCK